MMAPSVSATLARVLSDKPYSNNHAEVGRAELVLKESTRAKEALSVFSGFGPSYNKVDVNGITRNLDFFGEATTNNDKNSAGSDLRRPPTTPSKSELISSPAFQGDYVINRKMRPPEHINSTIDNKAVTRQDTDIPSWRTHRTCISYTISEDLSGDCRNQILSRIGKRKRDSEEIGILIGRSGIDSWSLRHQNEVSLQGPGSIPEPTKVKAQTLHASNNKRSRIPVGPGQSMIDNYIVSRNRSPTGHSNDPNILDSQRSSPVLGECDLSTSQLITSASSSPLGYSPSLGGVSPKCSPEPTVAKELLPYPPSNKPSRKTVGPTQSKVASNMASWNLAPTRTLEAYNKSMKFEARSSLELYNSSRLHPLYHDSVPKDDGLYHCPWESDPTCQHRPEKLKCNYDKFVDSHLKPYRCKVILCEASRFSSTECLLRHQREAHAMHGYGDKPYQCTYEGCDRSLAGNGFPRPWNLRYHMGQMHNDPRPINSSSIVCTPSSNGPARSM